jgi:predicted transcriptional regulator of viral defense system
VKRVAQVIWREVLPYTPVFTTAEVARITGITLPNASRDMAVLAAQGLVTRIRRGLWAVPTHPDFSPYAVVPHLFAEGREGYVSALSALHLLGMIDQIPRAVQVVTTTQRPRLVTPVGVYEFHQIAPALFGGFGPYRGTGSFDIATPEKALFDTLYLSARKGQRYAALPELEVPDAGFSAAALEAWIASVEHEPLRAGIAARWERLEARIRLSTPGPTR